MKRKLRGLKRQDFLYDFDLYRVNIPISEYPGNHLSVLDLWPEGADKTILFVHGYMGCVETWEFQINYFAQQNYRVIAPDLRGHGQSDAPLSDYTMVEIVADLQNIVETLKLTEPFILVGHSFGGSICVEYANSHPEWLEKLVLIATAGEYPIPKIFGWATRLPSTLVRPLWKYRPRWNAQYHVAQRMYHRNLKTWDGWPRLKTITTPTLVMTGERDLIFPRHVFDDVSKSIPNAQLIDVGSAKHKVQLERHQAVNRAIARFVDTAQQRASWRTQKQENPAFQERIWLDEYADETPPIVPIPQRPLPYFLENAALSVPNRWATLFYGAALTYQELDQRVNQFAHVLQQMQVKHGDRVMIVLPNIPKFIIAYYAILKVGAVVVLPNPDADAPKIVQYTRQTASKVLITLESFAELASIVERNTAVEAVILADVQDEVADEIFEQLQRQWALDPAIIERFKAKNAPQRVGQNMSDLMKDAPMTRPKAQLSHHDLAAIIFTSGTTDVSKGVCLSHANLVANVFQSRHWLPKIRHGEESFLCVIPLIHSYGMTNAMNLPITLGATIILMPVFQVKQVLAQIKLHRPTLFPGVPSMYIAINQTPKVRSYGLGSIKACVSGAAPLPIEVREAFEKLTHGRLVEGYGLTEASPCTHTNPLHREDKAGSIGIPLPNTEARIVDFMTGEPLPTGQIGELQVRGPQVMQGYWNQGGMLDRSCITAEGWLQTGDLAVCDGDGYFQIISRKRDTIMAGEYSVYPRDVEEVLYENAKVMEVAVVGLEIGGRDQDQNRGQDRGQDRVQGLDEYQEVAQGKKQQRIKAFVVPRPNSELTTKELLELCHRRLEPYAVPWEIEFRQELPKSFVGKVLRRMLIVDDK